MATPNLYNATSVIPKLVVSQLTTTAATTAYTVTAGKAAMVFKAVLTNVTGSAVTVSVSTVPSGGTAGTVNRVVSNFSLAANDTAPLTELEGMFLDEGAFVSVTAGTASAVDVVLSVLELS